MTPLNLLKLLIKLMVILLQFKLKSLYDRVKCNYPYLYQLTRKF